MMLFKKIVCMFKNNNLNIVTTITFKIKFKF